MRSKHYFSGLKTDLWSAISTGTVCMFSQACSGTTHRRAGNQKPCLFCHWQWNSVGSCLLCPSFGPFLQCSPLLWKPRHGMTCLYMNFLVYIWQPYLICTGIIVCKNRRVDWKYFFFFYFLWFWNGHSSLNCKFQVERGWIFSYMNFPQNISLHWIWNNSKQQTVQNISNCKLKPWICKCCFTG